MCGGGGGVGWGGGASFQVLYDVTCKSSVFENNCMTRICCGHQPHCDICMDIHNDRCNKRFPSGHMSFIQCRINVGVTS